VYTCTAVRLVNRASYCHVSCMCVCVRVCVLKGPLAPLLSRELCVREHVFLCVCVVNCLLAPFFLPLKSLTYVHFCLHLFPQKSCLVNSPKVLICAHTSTPVRLLTRVYVLRSVCMCVYMCVCACVCVHVRFISHSFTSRIRGSHMSHVTQTQLGHHPGGHH